MRKEEEFVSPSRFLCRVRLPRLAYGTIKEAWLPITKLNQKREKQRRTISLELSYTNISSSEGNSALRPASFKKKTDPSLEIHIPENKPSLDLVTQLNETERK